MRWAALVAVLMLGGMSVAQAAEVEIQLDESCDGVDASSIRRLFLAELLEEETSFDVAITCLQDGSIVVTLQGEPPLNRTVPRGEGVERVVAMVLVELREERRYASQPSRPDLKPSLEIKPKPKEPEPPIKEPAPEAQETFGGVYLGGAMALIWPPRAIAWGAGAQYRAWPARRWGWSLGAQVLTREDLVLRGGLRSWWLSADGWLRQELASPMPWRVTWGLGFRAGAQILGLTTRLGDQSVYQSAMTVWGGPMLGGELWHELGSWGAVGLQLEFGLPLRELDVRVPPDTRLEFDGPWASLTLGWRIL